MLIREARRTDAQAIARLHAQSWRIAYRGMLRDAYLDGDIATERESVWEERFRSPAANQHVVVAEKDNVIIGFACAYGGHDETWGTLLENLHVAQEHKRLGVGAQLLKSIASWCSRTHPGTGLHLWVLEANAPARSFYERLGAANVERSMWSAPDGSEVPELRFAWPSTNRLVPPDGSTASWNQ